MWGAVTITRDIFFYRHSSLFLGNHAVQPRPEDPAGPAHTLCYAPSPLSLWCTHHSCSHRVPIASRLPHLCGHPPSCDTSQSHRQHGATPRGHPLKRRPQARWPPLGPAGHPAGPVPEAPAQVKERVAYQILTISLNTCGFIICLCPFSLVCSLVFDSK